LRAVELRAFGGPDGFVLTELPDPEPGPGEVKVDLVAAALNRLARAGDRRAHAGEVLVSNTVVDLVAGSGLVFADRGEHELKGVQARVGCSRSRLEG
jgi:NADPH:quinone reductase-like Zn-dependent oxidoreductase